MKKIVSAPRLHQSSILQSSPVLMTQTQSRTTLVEEPVKLSEYLKNREEMNKSYIMERIKSNPLLVTYQDPLTKELREKKEFILRNTDKLVSLLTKKKTNIDSKSIDELMKDQELIQKLLNIFNESEKIARQANPFITSRKNLKNLGSEEQGLSRTNGFSYKPQTPKLNTSSYLNKADSVSNTPRSELAEKQHRIPPMPPKQQSKGGQNTRLNSELLNFSRKQNKTNLKN